MEKVISFRLETVFLLIAANHILMQRLRICGHCNGVIFMGILCRMFTKNIRNVEDSLYFIRKKFQS